MKMFRLAVFGYFLDQWLLNNIHKINKMLFHNRIQQTKNSFSNASEENEQKKEYKLNNKITRKNNIWIAFSPATAANGVSLLLSFNRNINMHREKYSILEEKKSRYISQNERCVPTHIFFSFKKP